MSLQKVITMFFRWYFNFFILLIVYACNNSTTIHRSVYSQEKESIHIKYAKHFGILKQNHKKIIFITENYKDTVFFEVNHPYSRIAVLGTIPAFQLYLLSAVQNIVAIDDIKYYNCNEIKKLYNSQHIAGVLPNLQWNYELLITSRPELLITYSDLSDNSKLQSILKSNHIQHLLYLDYLEQEPLGRAEWIKVLGHLINKDSLAEKIFSEIEQQYLQLKKCTDTCIYRPKILTETMYGDVWYIAGNQSYIAQLIKDAGGKYAFDFHTYENSQPYSLEYVLKYAQDADIWIHLHQFKSLQEIKNTNTKLAMFKAFQNKQCYNNNKIRNGYAYNDYYESGICMPHRILQDLIDIFHPHYLEQKEMHYYYPLPEK